MKAQYGVQVMPAWATAVHMVRLPLAYVWGSFIWELSLKELSLNLSEITEHNG